MKCVETKRVLKTQFASLVFHSCNSKTQKTQICVTRPQCVKEVFDEDNARKRIIQNNPNFFSPQISAPFSNGIT
jgi:hypothetical protein